MNGCYIFYLHLVFCRNQVLQQTDGIHDMGALRWQLLLLLMLAWLMVYLALWKGVKVTGKVSTYERGQGHRKGQYI